MSIPSFSKWSRRAFQGSALVLALGLTACANFSGISPQSQMRDPVSLGLADITATAPAVSAEWWREFGDAGLNTVVTQALHVHPSLGLARARLARAQAVTEVALTATGPQVNAGVDLTRQRYTANGPVPAPLAGSVRETGTVQLNASWELDFFGKNQAALEAALGAARAAEADAQAARVLLASNVARTWFQLARTNDQLVVAQRTLAQRQETLRLVRDRVDAGLDTHLELRLAEGGLPDTRQQIEALREQAALSVNALAALVGEPGHGLTTVPLPLSKVKLEKMPH